MLGPGYESLNLVFARFDSRPLKPREVTQAFWSLLQRNPSLPRIRLYDLRHSHATMLLRQDVHPKVVSERLGHSTVGITLDVYSHVMPGMQEAAAQKVDAALRIAIGAAS